jgi:hypothetical protein
MFENTKRILIISLAFLFLILCAAPATAQIRDSLRYVFSQTPKLFFQFDGYNSFVRNRGANAYGIKTGIDFGKKIRLGIGYMILNTDVVDSVEVRPNIFYRGEVKSHYFTTGIEYVLYRNDPWQINIPANIGFGNSYYEYPDGKRLNNKAQKGGIILFEPAITGHYKFVKWIGLGFGVGYRVMLKNNLKLTDRLSSPLYVFRLKIFLDEVVKSILPPKEKPKP